MIVDVTLATMKKMATSGEILRNETVQYIILYHPNQTPVIYRTVIKKPNDKFQYMMLIQSLPTTIPVFNVREFGGINE